MNKNKGNHVDMHQVEISNSVLISKICKNQYQDKKKTRGIKRKQEGTREGEGGEWEKDIAVGAFRVEK